MRLGGGKHRRHLAVRLCALLLLFGTLAGSWAGCDSSDATSTSAQGVVTTVADGTGSTSGGTSEAASGDVPGGDSTAVYPANAVYSQSGDSKSEESQTYTASEDDQSGILVSDGGSLAVTNARVETFGDTSSNGSSSFYGLNAAVVATAGSSITMSDSSITTTGSGANGAFATGEGAWVSLTDVTIEATGRDGHGVMATQGGSVTLDNVKITTSGANAAPLATDGGGGTITATGGSVLASGQDSPALYSTGTITVNGGTYEATGAEAAIIEASSSIVLTDVFLSSTMTDKWGVMLYQSMSGDAESATGTFTMTGGSLKVTGENSPVFYVTNCTGTIILEGVDITSASGVLVAAAAGNWGTSGSNGGRAILTTHGQTLKGDLVADSSSSLSINLTEGSRLIGIINADNTAKRVDLTIDTSSYFIVTADTYLTSVTLTGGVTGTLITTIIGNGHTVYYDATDAANSALGGQTFRLSGGGTLRPLS
jgi:hypothetical protein